MRNWLIVTDPINFVISAQRNFDMEGFQDIYEKTIKYKIADGDQFLYYIKGYKKFAAITEAIPGGYFYSEDIVWKSHTSNYIEKYPHRFRTKPICVLPEDRMLDAKDFAGHVKFLPFPKWGAGVRQSLKRIPQEEDFKKIKDAIIKRFNP